GGLRWHAETEEAQARNSSMLSAVISWVRWVLRPDRRRCIPSAWHMPVTVSVALVFRGRGLSLMFNNCEKLRLVNRHVAEIRQRLEAQEARAAELERSGGPDADGNSPLGGAG